VVGLLTLAAQLPFFDQWFNFMDEGHMVQYADMVLRGGEFYRDATFYPLPGAFYFLVLVFKVFGASVIVSRWVVVIQFAVFVALVFVFLERTASRSYAILGVLCMLLYRIWCFPHWHIYSYSTTSLLVLFAALLLLMRYFETGDRRTLGVSGFVFGLGVLCKQDYGAAAFVTAIAAMWVFARWGRPAEPRAVWPIWATFLLPGAAVGALTGLYYWHVGILDELLRFTVFNHFVGMSAYEYMSFPDLGPLFGQDPAYRTRIALMGYLPGILFTTDWAMMRAHPLLTDTFFYEAAVKSFIFGPPVYLMLSALRLWVIRGELRGEPGSSARFLREAVLVLFASCLITLVWLNKPQDYLHLAVLYWPIICLALVQAHALLSGHRRATLVTAAVLLLPALVVVAYSARMLRIFHEDHSTLVEGERAGIYAKPSEAAMLADVVGYMQANSEPGERVGTMPYFPIVNFLAERDGPHRSAYIVWPFPEIPERDERIVEAMEATGTDLVIYNFTQFHSFNPVWVHAPILFEYLVDNFEIDRVFSHDAWRYKLAGLRRVDPARAARGRPILPGGAAQAALSVVGEGPPRPVPPEARPAYVREMLWPFRPVVALRASSGGRRTVMSVPLHVPAQGGRIESAVAVHPQWWFKLPPSWVEFRLSVRAADGDTLLFERRLKPTIALADRDWFDVDASLDRWAGQEVTLELSTEAEAPQGESIWMSGWEVPRLVTPTDEDGQAEPG
jgi:hypothetical protein